MADFTWFYERGALPLLVSMPHVGTQLSPGLAARLTREALRLPDTDWHLPRLYDFLADMGANLLVAVHSRYVIDLNRDPSGTPLYPGADNSELVPLSTFERAPIYLPGQAPDAAEVAERLERYYRPYHAKLAEALAEIKSRHGYALLFEAHSIKSVLPRYFEGRLPDINLGTADGASADLSIGPALLEAAGTDPSFSAVLNGRYKGGYITRQFGRPAERVHAVQLELAWRTYMDEGGAPYAIEPARAARIRPVLKTIVERLVAQGRAIA
jgi:N-formylglutamate deformylase